MRDELIKLHQELNDVKMQLKEHKNGTLELSEDVEKYLEQRIKLIKKTISRFTSDMDTKELVKKMKEIEEKLDNPLDKKPLREGVLS